MEWVAASPPVGTPTTMIFNDGRLVWQHTGKLNDDSVRSARDVLRGVASKGSE
jgi:hypothetical protein